MTELRELLAPHYAVVKAIHVIAAGLWSFTTAVAYAYYLKPAFLRVLRNPDDASARATRDWLMERFDRGAAIEHVALVILVVTAGLMLWLGRFDLGRMSFVTAKLWIGILVILPMEAIDIHLSHLGGNKARIRRSGDSELYERTMARHWRFFRITEPLVQVLIPLMFVLAIVKPF
jgi:type IV secretory pathway VirB2 component (pilin)